MMVRGRTTVSRPLQISVSRCNVIVLGCLWKNWLVPLKTLLYIVYKFYLEYNNYFLSSINVQELADSWKC